jgi:EAL domain-containing protein (putative c-di-GMP-specific phosphodiesterase class I)/CHASE2 domain-containing sensor protein
MEGSSLKLLLWTAIAGLLFGLVAFGEPLEDVLRTARNTMHWHKASGDIVLVKIDDEAIREVGAWPWPRRRYAELTDKLTKAGADRIFFTTPMYGPTTRSDDRAFSSALERSGRGVLAVRTASGTSSRMQPGALPYAPLASHARLGSTTVRYNFRYTAWRMPYATDLGGRAIPSFAALLADRHSADQKSFMIDYSIDPYTIPAISARAIIEGKFSSRQVRGKDVIVGPTADAAAEMSYVPSVGEMASVYIHGLAGETLKAGRPVDVGWMPLFVVSLLVSALVLALRSSRIRNTCLAAFVVALLFAPAVLEAQLIYIDITPALFVVTVIWSVLGWRSYRERGLVNAISGLPNLNALQSYRPGRERALVVARILNYAEVIAALPTDNERQLVEQVISRLSLGSTDRIFYHGDGGIFAWFEKGEKPFGHHIEALYALFRNPVRVSGLSIDLSISFGVEIGSGRSPANRLASAIVAAEEAAHDGLKWKFHDPQVLEDASWKLSMLSQLDSAIDKGEVWIAFQPQLDLKTRQIVGAEALARWTHPEKGPIAASEFVAAAEQNDRIGKLTDFVLEKAVIAAAEINRRGFQFNVAVNLSARLLTDKQFTMRVAALLARHGLAPQRLTLELTETTELADGGEALDMLTRLRDLGIEISIDDYGTGLSTLDYLKKIPASEIKIDQSFVKGLCDNRSDRLMVHSTIGLAHSLERRVVAEGVEESETLEALIDMECDLAQGFIIGRPMSLESLLKRVSAERGRNVA